MTTTKLTAEARKHIITKSARKYRADVLTISLSDGKQGYARYEIAGDFDKDIDVLSAISARYSINGVRAVAPITNGAVEKIENRFAMFDDDFFANGSIIKDGDKIAGLMVRTLTLNTIKCLCADFDTQTFSEATICVVGDFDSADDAMLWYKKRTPDDKKIYGKFSMESVSVKIAMKPADFMSKAFAIDNTEKEGD